MGPMFRAGVVPVPSKGNESMTTYTVRNEVALTFEGCVGVGAAGLPDEGEALLESLCRTDGERPGTTRFEIPDHMAGDLRDAFVVGWEGLDPGDGVYEMAEEAARELGVSPAGPRP